VDAIAVDDRWPLEPTVAVVNVDLGGEATTR
jgi:hypothetical protein